MHLLELYRCYSFTVIIVSAPPTPTPPHPRALLMLTIYRCYSFTVIIYSLCTPHPPRPPGPCSFSRAIYRCYSFTVIIVSAPPTPGPCSFSRDHNSHCQAGFLGSWIYFTSNTAISGELGLATVSQSMTPPPPPPAPPTAQWIFCKKLCFNETQSNTVKHRNRETQWKHSLETQSNRVETQFFCKTFTMHP